MNFNRLHPSLLTSLASLTRLAALAVAVALLGFAPRRSSAAAAGDNEPERISVFDAGALGYKNCRIPGVAVTPRGTVLAWCEARHGNGGDWDPIDILLRRSTDGGRQWDEPHHLAGDGKHTYNNPVAVVDRDGGVVHFLYCVDYAHCYYLRSDDDGKTFSEPVDVTATFEPFRKDYDWNVIATGPCHGIQLKNGRLLVPVWLSTGGHKHHPSVVSTIYSDDHGKTWKRGEIAVQNTKEVPNPNETVAVELTDGRVMLNVRNESSRHRRVVVTSPDGATGWSKPAFDEQLPEVICNASILRLTSKPPADRDRIVFVNPNNDRDRATTRPGDPPSLWRERKDLTLRLSYDEGKTWPVSKVLQPGKTDYSDLAAGPDGTIYCIYNGLMIARVTLDWLTDGKDHAGAPGVVTSSAADAAGAAGAVPGSTRVARWKGDKTAAFLLMFDDSYPSHWQVAAPELLKRDMIATFYLNPGKAEFQKFKDKWEKELWKQGMVYGDHTMTHKGVKDLENADYEIGECARIIRQMIPDHDPNHPRLISYAQPGVAAGAWNITDEQQNELLNKYHLVSRGDAKGHMAIYHLKTPGQMLALADAAVEKKGVEYLIIHGVERIEPNWGYQDFWPLKQDMLRDVLDGLKDRRDKGDLWITDHISAHKYEKERDGATVKVLEATDQTIRLAVTSTTDAAVYDQPLTLVTRVPASWKQCEVVQGASKAAATAVDGLLRYEALPNGQPVAITGR